MRSVAHDDIGVTAVRGRDVQNRMRSTKPAAAVPHSVNVDADAGRRRGAGRRWLPSAQGHPATLTAETSLPTMKPIPPGHHLPSTWPFSRLNLEVGGVGRQ